MPDPESRIRDLTAKLRLKGFRHTPQRVAVLGILAASEEHPSADDIYEQVKTHFPTTSLATNYRTTNLLKDMCEVLELGFCDSGNRYDGSRPYPDPHLVCTDCASIEDLTIPELNGLPQRMADMTGHQLGDHRMDFFGVCPQRWTAEGKVDDQQQNEQGDNDDVK